MKKGFLKQIFCHHVYWYMGGTQGGHRTLPYIDRTVEFHCEKCGKVKKISYKEYDS